MDPFTLIVTVGMVAGFLGILALGLWHPRSGADVLEWRPTRSAELEAQNDIDDVEQMIAAQNRMREKRGVAARTKEDVEAQVEADQSMLREYADAYWSEQRERRIAEVNASAQTIVLYQQATCSKCQRVARILDERGIDYERVELASLSGERVAPLLAKAEVTPLEAFRGEAATDAEALAAMTADPALVQRPIVERGDRAILARPAERVLQLL